MKDVYGTDGFLSCTFEPRASIRESRHLTEQEQNLNTGVQASWTVAQ